MSQDFNELKMYFDKIIPDNLKEDTPILYESFLIFLDVLNSKKQITTNPHQILDLLSLEESPVIEEAGIDVSTLRDEFTNIYLRNIYDGIKSSVQDYAITSKIDAILELYGLEAYNSNEELINTTTAITDETILTSKELSQTKGSFRSYDYTFNIMKELNIVKILSTFNEFFLRTYEGRYNDLTKEFEKEEFVYSVESSVSAVIFDRVLRNILHPVGFDVVYSAIITSLFEDWYSDKRTIKDIELVISCKGNPSQSITAIKKDVDGSYMYEEQVRIYKATSITTIQAHLDNAPIQTVDGLIYATYIEKVESGDINIYVGDDLATTLSAQSCILYAKIDYDYEFLLSDEMTDYRDVLHIEYWDKEIHWENLELDWRLFGDYTFGDAEHYNYNFFVYEYKDITDYYDTVGIEDITKLKLVAQYKDISISEEDLVSVRYGNHIARVVIVKERTKNLNDGMNNLEIFSPQANYDEFFIGSNFLIGGENLTNMVKIRDGVERTYWLENDSEYDSDLVFDINVNTTNIGDTTINGLVYHFDPLTQLTINIESVEHSFLSTNNITISEGDVNLTSSEYTYTALGLIDGNYTVTVKGTNLLGLDMVTKQDFVVNWQD